MIFYFFMTSPFHNLILMQKSLEINLTPEKWYFAQGQIPQVLKIQYMCISLCLEVMVASLCVVSQLQYQGCYPLGLTLLVGM